MHYTPVIIYIHHSETNAIAGKTKPRDLSQLATQQYIR